MRVVIILSILSLIYFSSCQKDEFDYSQDVKLQFSTDSIVFDTIFSGIGSATRTLKVYNPSEKKISISKINLGKESGSKYRLNIDGLASSSAKDITIAGKDSMYLFVEVTINTDQDMLLEQDSIIFETNGNHQDIKLLAWGQDVHFIDGEIINTSTWINDKPYLIYNSMLVDTNQVLTIEAGTHLHFHRGSRMYVAGTLEINGTFEDPVVLESDRLEYMYFDVPGQWDGIWLMNGSSHNDIEYAEIKNAVIGIQVDTLADLNVPTMTISNSKIEHMSYAGIYAQGSTIFASNCVVADCAYYAVALTIGGSYEFYHCTIANYWQNTFRNTPSLVLNNYYEYEGQAIIRDIDKATFGNCIIWGDKENELYIDKFPDAGILNYMFDHCFIRISDETEREPSNFIGSILNEDPLFVNTDNYDYQLDTLSPAINQANIDFINLYPTKLTYDLNGFERLLNSKADVGAYERVEGK
ncbi:MAG: right-handed parallel beta-helix repeat-containing protein [Bacteroidota bacterium]